jgi:hypothetical protein
VYVVEEDMWKDILKQMIPFLILLAVLWLSAEVLENSMGKGLRIIAPPIEATRTPAP